MGGELNWGALPVLADLLEVENAERWILGVVAIRNLTRRAPGDV